MVATIADCCGLAGKMLSVASPSLAVNLLRANTQEAIDRGAYGSPNIFVDRKLMYFGNDQLLLVRQRLS